MNSINITRQTLLQGGSVWNSIKDKDALRIPEISCGFLKAAWSAAEFPLADTNREEAVIGMGLDPDERQIPSWYHEELAESGNYRVTVKIEVSGKGRVTLFANHRQMVFSRVYESETQITETFLLHMGGIIPRFMTEERRHTAVDLTLLGRAEFTGVAVQKADVSTVFVMGDSTVTDQSADVPWSPLTSYSGWGQMLPAFFREIAVSNHAHSGLTTESFRSEGHWDVMKKELRAGDIALMQFGHNDQKLAHLQANTGYAENLRVYVKELREMGVTPVFVTPLARNTWFGTGEYNDLLEAHGNAVFAVGKELNVPVIDLHGFAMGFIKSVGMESARVYFYPNDYTHTNDHGAYMMADFVSFEMEKALGIKRETLAKWLPDTSLDRSVPPKALKDAEADKWKEASTNLPKEISEPEKALTRAEAFDMVVKACRFFGINVYNDHFEDVTGHETWAGTIEAAVMNGLIPPEMVADKKICPDKAITPSEFAAVLILGAKARLPKWESKANDAQPAYTREAVGLLMSKNLWKSDWNGKDTISRGEALKLCAGLMG